VNFHPPRIFLFSDAQCDCSTPPIMEYILSFPSQLLAFPAFSLIPPLLSDDNFFFAHSPFDLCCLFFHPHFFTTLGKPKLHLFSLIDPSWPGLLPLPFTTKTAPNVVGMDVRRRPFWMCFHLPFPNKPSFPSKLRISFFFSPVRDNSPSPHRGCLFFPLLSLDVPSRFLLYPPLPLGRG